jgi:Putative lumazine-binding
MTDYRNVARFRILRGVVVAGAMLATSAHAQTSADSAAIRATAMDYIEGWYSGDPVRMERALHPELAKRVVTTDAKTGRSQLESIGAMTLVLRTRAGGGSRTPAERQQKDFTLLDVFNGAAVAKIVASDWVDYLELAKWNGRWVIVNVLWEYKMKMG